MTTITTTMSLKTRTAAPPIVSRRNKSLVSLQESLQEGFMKHNLDNRSGATLFPVMEDRLKRDHPARISPTSSCNDLHEQLQRGLALRPPLTEPHGDDNKNDNGPSPRPLKKRKIFEARVGQPAMVSAESISHNGCIPDERIRQRKALAASLRAGGVKLVLRPSEFARSIFCKNRTEFAPPPTPVLDPCPIEMEIHAKHSQEIYDFVRKGTDLEGFKKCVRELHKEYHGEAVSDAQRPTPPFRCANRFGESLLHLACRRGRTAMVRFLVLEMGSSPREELATVDDCRKTPLHDACWTPTPNFELVHFILEQAPELVMRKDIRGNTPFDYVRRDDYGVWLRFLWERRSLLQSVTTTGETAGASAGTPA